jgi:hypothetical protein
MDPNMHVEGADATPVEIAQRSRAVQFLMSMQKLGHFE